MLGLGLGVRIRFWVRFRVLSSPSFHSTVLPPWHSLFEFSWVRVGVGVMVGVGVRVRVGVGVGVRVRVRVRVRVWVR